MSTETASRERSWVPSALVAVVATVALLFLIWRVGTGDLLRPPSAPLQNLEFTRVVLTPGHIEIDVRNAGPDEITIAQVLIDDAYWQFTSDADGPLGRLDTATIELDYPWVAGEPIGIIVVDGTGTTFEHEIGAATETPSVGGRTLLGYVLLGVYAGVVPVFLGLLFLPALRRLRERGWAFLLGITGGLLVFLALDTLVEALELAPEVPGAFQGIPLVIGAALAAMLVLSWVGRALRGRDTAASGLMVAYFIAIGIGLHNLGEGLAIGSAQALGEVALGSFLVMGFALHNLTEGIGIIAPTVRKPPHLGHLLALGAIAGLPTIVGTLVGGFAYSNVLAMLFLAIGAGAILQVVWELLKIARRDAARSAMPLALGAMIGFLVMYGTGLLVKS